MVADLNPGHRLAPSRRSVLLGAGAAVLTSKAFAASSDKIATGTADAMREAIRKLVGNAPIQPGRVKLDLPPLVENGNSVQLAVTVDSPMSEEDHVTQIHLFSEKNPLPTMAVFFLGPRSGRASVVTRVRLADSQTVTALCQMSDGSFWSDSASVLVTLAACVEPI